MQNKYIIAIMTTALVCACQPNDQYINAPTNASSASSTTTASAPIVASAPAMASAASDVASASEPVAASAAASAPATDYSKANSQKVFVEHDEELGNKLYLFSGSLKKEGKLVYALTENRFAKPQTLPESNKTFQYSLIKEAVDCQKRLTDPVEVTHFSPTDEIVEKHTFPYPDYASWSELEIKALADEHPNRQFIETVCRLAK